MKNYFKFVVMVFGITLATIGSMKSNATGSTIRCLSGSTLGCAKTESGHWLVGIKQVTPP